MQDNTIWPPKPDLPDPLTEYDEVIAAKLATLSETKAGPNKIQLIKALRDEEGMELRQALALSKSYCDRHGLPIGSRAFRATTWGGCGLAVAMLGLIFFDLYLVLFRSSAILSQPHHRTALLAFDREQIAVSGALLIIAIVFAVLRQISTKK